MFPGRAAVGAIAGGYAGKGVGELIDPTTEDNWLRESFGSKSYVQKGETFETYRPAYRYGAEAEARYMGRKFDEVEADLRSDWEKAHAGSGLTWDRARAAVRDAFDRTIQLREERLKVSKTPVQTGEVSVRKEVHTEQKTITVPVEREEVVIERRPVSGHAATGDIQAEEIRIPVKEEKVHVEKEAVVTEEVSVGKRKVQDTEHVSGTVRKEEVKVEKKGDVEVRNRADVHERK